MKSYTSLKSILAEFFPLHRTLASDDHDKTLEIISSYMPDSSNYTMRLTLHSKKPGHGMCLNGM
jgi:hypothetical protein